MTPRHVRKRLADARLARVASYREDDHPEHRAAIGRALAYTAVPQRGSRTPEAVAWHRETGAAPGYMNRTARKKEHHARG